MEIVYSPEAVEELAAVIEYIAERNPTAAKVLGDKTFATIEHLADGKFEGFIQKLKSGEEVRSWPVRPLRIYDQRQDDLLSVVRIYHQSRKPIV